MSPISRAPWYLACSYLLGLSLAGSSLLAGEEPRHTLRVGGDSSFPPYELLDSAGRPTGFNVDLMHAVADAVGLEVQIQLGP